MQVSVVVPTFNRPERLDKALQSIALQNDSRGPQSPGGWDGEWDSAQVEVIVVNDGGVDVGDIVDGYSGTLKLQYVNLPGNGGLAHARNEGIRRANNDVLCFLDDDDLMLPGHLRTGLRALAATDADVVYTQVAVCDQFIEPGAQPAPNQIRAWYRASFDPRLLHICNFIPVNSVFIRRPASFDATLGLLEDWDLWLRLLTKHDYRFHHVPVVTTVYHRVPGFSSMTSRAEAVGRFRDTFRTIIDRYPSNDPVVHSGRAAHEAFYNEVARIERDSAFSYERFVESMAQKIKA
jgi:glycosyltransferase involved in cell wall biosynthesis